MKRNILTIAAMALFAASASANTETVKEMNLDVENAKMRLHMVVDPSEINVKSTQAAIFTPMVITAAGDTISFQSAGIYGRRNLINAERLGKQLPAGLLSSAVGNEITIGESLDYTPELNGARPALKVDLYGCADCLKWTKLFEGQPWEAPTFDPTEEIVFEVPTANVVKERAASGRANVEFPVNQTVLLPDFRNNADELAKVAKTIDSVKNDPDITITAIYLKGFASPEGSYANNTRLAEGRTEALRQWIQQRYQLPSNLLHTSYEPEDWEGLVAALEADPDFPNREGLLEIINDPRYEPDARDYKMRITYPDAYKRMLNEIYPSLRHTDYRVEYIIRSYSTAEEVMTVIEQDPTKLTAAEYFLAAQSLDPESERYEELIMMAAKYDPSSEAANLNAASISLKHGDLPAADSYLAHAGKSPAAEYTRGLLAVEADDLRAAEQHLRNALNQGYEPAGAVLEKVSHLKKFQK